MPKKEYPSKEYEKVVKLAKALHSAEQWRLLDQLELWLCPYDETMTEDEIELEQLREGILDHVPRKPTKKDIERFEKWKPVKVKGKPVSETIIEERR